MSLYNVNRVFEKIARTKIGDMLIRSIENGQGKQHRLAFRTKMIMRVTLGANHFNPTDTMQVGNRKSIA